MELLLVVSSILFFTLCSPAGSSTPAGVTFWCLISKMRGPQLFSVEGPARLENTGFSGQISFLPCTFCRVELLDLEYPRKNNGLRAVGKRYLQQNPNCGQTPSNEMTGSALYSKASGHTGQGLSITKRAPVIDPPSPHYKKHRRG